MCRAAAHRRVNLLIYLNKDWDSDWGGDIELHSDPRHPQDNRISAYRVDFNRAVLFETNEHSWHGFPQIHLPEALRATHSRKCISIYLYTRERPVEEIAGEHGTFYVQRPCRPASAPAMCWMKGMWPC
jgi:Rps23 Pro-64 3,4-dihydroxylase Tpa1-like proline 4-hydroxylase